MTEILIFVTVFFKKFLLSADSGQGQRHMTVEPDFVTVFTKIFFRDS
jgi:hypothetical protein